MSHSHSAYIISEEAHAQLVQMRDTFRQLSGSDQFREAAALLKIPDEVLMSQFERMADEVDVVLGELVYLPADRH